jgi:hypothetical protein
MLATLVRYLLLWVSRAAGALVRLLCPRVPARQKPNKGLG